MKKTTLIIIGVVAVVAFTTVLNTQAYWIWSDWDYGFWNRVQVRVGGEPLGITFANMAIEYASHDVSYTLVRLYAGHPGWSELVWSLESNGPEQGVHYRTAPELTFKVVGDIIGRFYIGIIKFEDHATAELTVPYS